MRIKTKLGLRATLFLTAIWCFSTNASAYYDFKVDGIEYTINEDDPSTVTLVYSEGGISNDSGCFTIPSTVHYNGKNYTVIGIGDYAFENSTFSTIKDIIIPNTVLIIGDGAFRNAATAGGGYMGYNRVVIGKSVKTIGYEAFFTGSTNFLTDVTCLAKNPPEESEAFGGSVWSDYTQWLESIDRIYHEATLYVPRESVEAYKTAPDWCRFEHIVGIDVPADIPEDVNGDGSVNITDVNKLIEVIISTKYETDLTIYDVNGDGAVNISDVNQVVHHILGH